MQPIQAIGFDLFNTLITVDTDTMRAAHGMLIASLRKSDLSLEEEGFQKAYREAAVRHMDNARRSGRETHNRFWICEALQNQGHTLSPEDPRISTAVEDYFSAFYPRAHLIPGTLEMLGALRQRYRLGLLSNFTHGPAAWRILTETGLTPFFHVILISGEEGYRKPSPILFRRLVAQLSTENDGVLYIGDDPDADILGALSAGLQPVWTTYAMDHKVSHAPVTLAREDPAPGPNVPRISGWEDLFKMLSPIT
ncbi:MAG: HAD family hydrolase [Thermodesulfobacteriota bacterium]